MDMSIGKTPLKGLTGTPTVQMLQTHLQRWRDGGVEDNEDPELLREKARSLRALGLEPPRAHHFRQIV